MGHWQKAYFFGMALAMVLLVTGELIWLPDPLRFGTNFYWIDVLDQFIYAFVLIPLIWMIVALLNIIAARPAASHIRWVQFRSWAVFIAGAVAAIAILTVPKQLVYSVGALGVAWLLVFVDLFFNERNRRKFPVQSVSVFILTICVLSFLFWPTSYMVTYPGLTMNMNRYAQAKGGNVHGEISGLLVFERPAFPVDWIYAKLFPHYTFQHIEKLGMSLGAYDQLSRSMKEDANAAGSAIAFQKLGNGKGITSHGVLITAVIKSSPAEGIMQGGDIIEEINSMKVSKVQDLTERMSKVSPGQQVKVLVLRGGKRIPFTIETRANPDDPKRAAFGIQVSDELQYDIPGTVTYHNYLVHEGGPSHGAMLALVLIDQLTPYGVTNGNRVAGTGTIGQDGSIGPVGGVEQKAYTVNRAGVDVFFVPFENEADAKRGAPDLQIVPVHTLDDILNWLWAHPKTR
ncbi:PDZ domain-containing protein [Paenibacillus sp. GP183]|uniref:PDZ domain-containing protein n=1 Tax=Paenibacillus sp. GP183 TaxID=1882751 RepID=UPI0011153EE0|nr:PDZ domain-containing protein [Paenibacillus sp. GP183]